MNPQDLPENAPWFNLYPDSLAGGLSGAAAFLATPEVRGVFGGLYLLPSVFHSDLDRGFSIIDYGLEESVATPQDLEALKALGLGLKLDFVLNHASVQSPQFQDLLARGRASPYAGFFLDWNRFWEGRGTMTAEGYLQPDPEYLAPMFFRKPGLPLLMVTLPDGERVPYWNTFYQQTVVEDGLVRYLGQMDLDIRSPLVWEFYDQTLKTLAGYGAKVVRLDAFAYAPKEPGARNFLNDPGTWVLLQKVQDLARPLGLTLLPEIHSAYETRIHETLAAQGYLTYDFYLPGLVLDAFETRDARVLTGWYQELQDRRIRTVNMLGCHDGIPVLDLQGLLPGPRIEALIGAIVARGGFVKDLHGQKNVYYQVNATYFTALGEDEDRLVLARALQIFAPGIPQVWYLDLFAGRNDTAAVERAGSGGHKEINRTNLDEAFVEAGRHRPVVTRQLELLRLRRECGAFGWDARLEVRPAGPGEVRLTWRRPGWEAHLDADLTTSRFRLEARGPDGWTQRVEG